MFMSILSAVGLERFYAHEVVVLLFGMVLFCVMLGWLADAISDALCFGVVLNAFVMFFSLWIGLITYNVHVRQLRFETPLMVAMLAIAFAVAGLLAAVSLRKGILRARLG